VDDCDHYDKCGAFASCNVSNLPPCNCLDGFGRKTEVIHSSCVRRTSLNCQGDGFLKFSGLKLPDTERSWFDRNISLENCKTLCIKNCSCTAYAALDVSRGPSGCLLWFNDLIDIKEMTEADEDIYIRMAGKEVGMRLYPSLEDFFPCFFLLCYLVSFLTLSQLLSLSQKPSKENNHINPIYGRKRLL